MTEIIAMLKKLAEDHCTCDLMAGWVCSIHEDVRKIVEAIEKEL